MPKKQTTEQKDIIGRVMHEFKHGELESNGGGTVRNPKQAIAIALREAGSSNQELPPENRRALRRTRQGMRGVEASQDRQGETRAALYARAKRAGVPGRSKMSRAELQDALSKTAS